MTAPAFGCPACRDHKCTGNCRASVVLTRSLRLVGRVPTAGGDQPRPAVAANGASGPRTRHAVWCLLGDLVDALVQGFVVALAVLVVAVFAAGLGLLGLTLLLGVIR